jgi:hypothetical protein
MQLLTERYNKKIQGVIACYDRVVIHGTLPGFNYAEGMTSFLKANNIRIFDYPRFAQTHRDDIRTNAEAIAKEHEIEIQFIQKTHIRKDDIIKNIIKERGDHPGLVAILSAMESCQAYKPWHDKNTHQTYLRYTQGKCLSCPRQIRRIIVILNSYQVSKIELPVSKDSKKHHIVLKHADIHTKGSTFSMKKIWKYSRQSHEVSLISMVFRIKISESISCKKPAVKYPEY